MGIGRLIHTFCFSMDLCRYPPSVQEVCVVISMAIFLHS